MSADRMLYALSAATLLLLLAGCGGSDGGTGPHADAPSVAARAASIPLGEACSAGGIEVFTGIDENGNGVLDDSEVEDTSVVCNGEDGADGTDGAHGRNSLLLVDNQVAGTCDGNGVRVRAGLDDNDNGTLDAPAEVDDTAFVCVPGVAALRLEQIARYAAGADVFEEGAAEIIAYDPGTARLFVINSDAGTVDVLSITDPGNPTKIGTIDAAAEFAQADGINSVAVANGVVAIAVEHDDGTQPGRVQFYNAADLNFRGQVEVGVLPDAVTFTPDGNTVLVANEGEPVDDYSADPKGSVSIIDVSNLNNPTVQALDFTAFNTGGPRADELPEDVRVFGNSNPTALTVTAFTDTEPATLTVDDASGLAPGDFFTLASSEGDPISYRVDAVAGNVITLADDFDGDSEVTDAGTAGLTVYLHDGQSSVAQDLEPEYIAVAPDGETAWVTLQENNAVAVIDIANTHIDAIYALGYKDHSIPGNGFDASNEDGGVNIRTWPVRGLYLPDTIASYAVNGQTYYITANEGDAREYDAYVEEVDIEVIGIDPESFANADALDEDAQLGELSTSLAVLEEADTDGDGLLDILYAFGARSFSIWRPDGTLVFDSGNAFEVITAKRFGSKFNNDNDENDPDGRSDNKGPEPEALTVAEIRGRQFAFIGLERIGGIMVYDVTNPASPVFMAYTNNRDFSVDIEAIDDGNLPAKAAGDLGPESVVFIPAADSPIDKPLLAVGNEVSGTTTLYRVIVD